MSEFGDFFAQNGPPMKERKKRKKRGEAVATAGPSQNGKKVVWSLFFFSI